MANTVTATRHSSSVKTLLVENDATTLDGSTYVAIIDAIDVETYERASIKYYLMMKVEVLPVKCGVLYLIRQQHYQ